MWQLTLSSRDCGALRTLNCAHMPRLFKLGLRMRLRERERGGALPFTLLEYLGPFRAPTPFSIVKSEEINGTINARFRNRAREQRSPESGCIILSEKPILQFGSCRVANFSSKLLLPLNLLLLFTAGKR